MQLDGYYINLDSATKRRETLEKNLTEVGFSERISMRRFSGVVPSAQEAQHFMEYLPGFLPGHLGCFLSHKAVLWKKISKNDGNSHLLVAEDDVQFSPRTEFFLDKVLSERDENDWDLFFPDFIVYTQEEKIAFYAELSRFRATNSIVTIDLKRHLFTGTTCYVVNRNSLQKYKSVLDGLNPVNKLIDWHIQEQVHAGKLIAIGVLPFITTVSKEADASLIDGGIPLSRYNNFIRRHLWIDAPSC